jgi:hypothetical protein
VAALEEVFGDEFSTGRVIGGDTGKPRYLIHYGHDREALLANPLGHRVPGRPIVNNAIHPAIKDGIICIFHRCVVGMTVEEEVVSNFATAIL